MMMDEWRMIKGEWRMIRMNDRGWKKNDEGWMMNDEGWWLQAIKGFLWLTDRQMNEQTNEQTDICECGVAFATEKRDWTE